MAWTAPRTWVAGELVTAALLNTHVRDNESLLKTSILDDGRLAGELRNFREEITSVSFSATPTFDLSLSNNFKLGALTGNVTSITISNWTASKATTATIRFTQDGTGGRTVAFPAGWKWSGGTAPTVTATANKNDIVVLYSDDGGTTIFASMLTQNA